MIGANMLLSKLDRSGVGVGGGGGGHDPPGVTIHALFTEYRDRRIKNDRGKYVTKQARQGGGA